MKQHLLVALALLTIAAGCATGAPPSGIERALYHVTTNLVTNVVQVAQVNPTNNVVTNIVFHTNVYQTYQLEPRESVITGIQTGGTIATTFGFGAGGIIASLLLGAYGTWATWRSKRKGDLNTVLAQGIETAREILKAQPEGGKLDSAFKAEIKSQQVFAGVKAAAAVVADEQVNTVKAKESADRVLRP